MVTGILRLLLSGQYLLEYMIYNNQVSVMYMKRVASLLTETSAPMKTLKTLDSVKEWGDGNLPKNSIQNIFTSIIHYSNNVVLLYLKCRLLNLHTLREYSWLNKLLLMWTKSNTPTFLSLWPILSPLLLNVKSQLKQMTKTVDKLLLMEALWTCLTVLVYKHAPLLILLCSSERLTNPSEKQPAVSFG